MVPHILVVEDDTDAADMLARHLELEDFRVSKVESYEKAEQWISENKKNPPDVAVLDMNLGKGKTGAEVGKLIQAAYRDVSVELIFFTAYNDRPFWEAAVRLSIATYLSKSGQGYELVIANARVLALRRKISSIPIHQSNWIESIVHRSGTILEAYQLMLAEIFIPEFQKCLGIPFFFLLDFKGECICVSSEELELPQKDSAYPQLQLEIKKLIPGEVLAGKVFQAGAISKEFKADLMPLFKNQHLNLSFGLLDEVKDPETRISKLMVDHMHPLWLERMISMVDLLFEQKLRKLEQLGLTTRFCRALGRLHKGLYEEAQSKGELSPGAVLLPRFRILGSSLRKVETQLDVIDEDQAPMLEINLSTQVNEIWAELAKERNLDPNSLFSEENIKVMANRADVRVIIRRILSWFCSRIDHYREGMQIRIDVTSEKQDDGSLHISFQDYSRRLPSLMLDELFFPFNDVLEKDEVVEEWIGLFLAKMLVEVRLGGTLSEESSLLSSGIGHLFCLTLQGGKA